MSPVLLAGLCGAAPAPSLSCSTAFSCSFSLGEPSPGLAAALGKGIPSQGEKEWIRITKFHEKLQIPASLSSWRSLLGRAEPPALPELDAGTSSTSQNPAGCESGRIPEPGIVLFPSELGCWDRGAPQGMSPRESGPAVPREGPWAPLGSTRAIRSQPAPGMNPPVEPPQFPDPVSFWKPRPKPVQRE